MLKKLHLQTEGSLNVDLVYPLCPPLSKSDPWQFMTSLKYYVEINCSDFHAPHFLLLDTLYVFLLPHRDPFKIFNVLKPSVAFSSFKLRNYSQVLSTILKSSKFHQFHPEPIVKSSTPSPSLRNLAEAPPPGCGWPLSCYLAKEKPYCKSLGRPKNILVNEILNHV